MGNEIDRLRSTLRKQVSKFVASQTGIRQPLRPIFDKIRQKGWMAFLFGGALRDLIIHGLKENPRDLDIVVSKMTPELEKYLTKYLEKRTRFDGFQVRISDWDFDIWALEDTWAFRENHFSGKAFSDLPKTTFLDIQAVVAELIPKPGKSRKIYSNGFFEAVLKKTIDINFEDNPFPKLCVLSALTTARKLDFAVAPRLTKYILHHVERLELEELVDLQQRHYKRALFDCDTLTQWIASLKSQHREAPKRPANLTCAKIKQSWLPIIGFQDCFQANAANTVADCVNSPVPS